MLTLLFTSDSTIIDTVQIYEIPEIVQYQDGMSVTGMIIPRYYERSIGDVLANLPITALSYGFAGLNGVASKGAKPYYTRILLNGRQQRDDFIGYFNIDELALHSFRQVAYGQNIVGSGLSSMNFESKVNRYDKPYSYARFAFGSFQRNEYGIDLTRAITNELGLYASGEYDRRNGFRDHTDTERLSVYAHLYYNHFFPARLDLFYSDRDYGFPGTTLEPIEGRQEDEFLDISATVAPGHSVMNFFYNVRNTEYADSENANFLGYHTKQLGVNLAHHYELIGVAVDYGVASCFLRVNGTVTSYTDVPLELWARLSKTLHPVALQFAGYFSKAGDHENFYCPKLELDYDVYGFTHLYLLLSRDARAPSDLETNADYDTLNPYFQIDGKEDLASEYCWIQEVGLRRDQFSLGYYRFNYDDFITVIEGPANQYEYTNIDAWVITGCDAHLDVPLRFCDTDSSRTIVIVVGASGNIIFEGDSVPFTPSYRIGGHLSFTKDTRRFGFGAAIRGEVYGRNIDLQGQESPGFAVISAAGLVKFMGLSVVARINNVLDEAYAYVPYYPMPGRNYDVSVKWEFWD
jgi:hypothetical protein